MWMSKDALRVLSDECTALEQAKTLTQLEQARLIELRRVIATADTEPRPDDGLVEVGMEVTVRFGDGSGETFLLSAHPVAGYPTVSPSSPLGTAISGAYVGARVSFSSPTGTPLDIAIISARPHEPIIPPGRELLTKPRVDAHRQMHTARQASSQ